MRKSLLLPLFSVFLLFLPGTGSCGEIVDCRTIAAILSVYPALDVRNWEGPVGSLPDGTERPGCRVQASGPAALISGEVDPADALRIHFSGSGWKEDDRFAADGPGTTSFAFRKDGVFCRAAGGAHEWIEDGKTVTSEGYEITVECAAQSE